MSDDIIQDAAETMRSATEDQVFTPWEGIAQALAAARLLCTPDERQLLDDIADNPRLDTLLDEDGVFAEIEVRQAVIDAAIAETNAEMTEDASRRTSTAFRDIADADMGIARIEARQARRNAVNARQARRDAVRRLRDLGGRG